jgi:hypothetical protein
MIMDSDGYIGTTGNFYIGTVPEIILAFSPPNPFVPKSLLSSPVSAV